MIQAEFQKSPRHLPSRAEETAPGCQDVSMDESQALSVELQVKWPQYGLPLPVIANQFVLQFTPGPTGSPDHLVLTFGYVAPPVVAGTDRHANREQLQEDMRLTIQPSAAFALSRDRAAELARILQTAVAGWDAFAV